LYKRAKGLIITVIIAACVITYNPVFSVSVGPISELEAEIRAEAVQEPDTGTKADAGSGRELETTQTEGRDRQNLASRGDSVNRGDVSQVPQADESVWYCSKIPMKKEHQKLLWEQSIKNGVDYIDMLALIALESNFDEKSISANGKYRGYFQISTVHGKNLSAQLGTKNDPLNGEVNIIWGTTMFGWIMKDKRVISLEGEKKLDVALSIYNRGSGGFDRYGIKESYVNMFRQRRKKILSYFENQ